MSDFVEFRHLKYIVAVAETGNFTRAAERLFLAQPSLSKQIRDIEQEIGFQIFLRTPDGVFPTPIGQLIVDYATSTLHGRHHVLKLAKEIFLGNVPPLRMGFSNFVNGRHLKNFRAAYERHFPKCGFQLSGGDTVHILQRLERGDLDCAILTLPISGLGWQLTQIATTPLVICMRVDDPLADHKSVTLTEIAERLTVFRDPDAHPLAHARLLQMMSEAGVPLHISSSAATPHDIQLLVRDGFGLALVGEDMLLESDLTTRTIGNITWTSDTAFVHRTSSQHPSLPFIQKYILGNERQTVKKDALPHRPQLSLRFDFSA